MTQLSFLDLVPICQGSTLTQAFANAAQVAQACEAAGYHRYWVAEHHGMLGVGAAATSVVLAHVGAHTQTIRIGAGGIMLPNHAPMQIAEQFGTLDALYPGRIDLALGRAPGSDGRVAQALRRGLQGGADGFVQDVLELQAMFAGDPSLGVTAVPGAGANPQIWILGSSTYGAQLAAALGLPYGFASHFAPAMLEQALLIYRHQFQPSEHQRKPQAMVAVNVFAADTAEEAELLASSMQQGFVALRSGSAPTRFRPPVPGYYASLPHPARAMLDEMLRYSAVGTREQVADQLRAIIAQTQADEIILSSQIYDHAARLRSIDLAAQAFAMATQAPAPAE
ncbi:MsnO8 family LLM class oxidoreductase [Novosphingobium sp. FSY-8]|uniref:MsnO8 family LLM class oxidoreductase n=1 Tax=Novosphingobium ovatum TaxID=1908523 RepID=A0ABW9X9T5_9SPHN|nr:LLM class flavin-dependent oxidoreductase [Novosphingobium ovatum]NBC35286.1 MsnO8 family LLM class oxidoreductase [Novosphingobium ovatum]